MFKDDNTKLYEQKDLWNPEYWANPYFRTKVRLLKGMIPDTAKKSWMLDGETVRSRTNARLTSGWSEVTEA